MSNSVAPNPSRLIPMDDPLSSENSRISGLTESGRPRHPPRAPSSPASTFVHGWMLAAVSLVVFLAAGPAEGSLGIFLVCAGLALTFLPARTRVEWPLWIAAGGLVGGGALALLPAHWFHVPPWRIALGAAPDIHLPSTATPVPWETGFWLSVLAISCLIGLFLLAHPVRSRAALRLGASAVVVCGVYAALSIYARQTGWHYPFTGDATFGFFPNRNHTATFLATGSIVALGVLTIGLRENRWTLSAIVGAAMAFCVAGLFFFSGSRGGVIFLMLGTLIWVAGLGGVHRNVPLLVSVAALAVAGSLLFVVSGGEARARLLGTNGTKVAAKAADQADSAQQKSVGPIPGNDHDTPLDFRVSIYRDAFALMKDAPVSGTGLGAFAPVFAQYRRASLSASASIHPESDWLMLTAEAGVPAMVFALLAGGLLMMRLRGAQAHPFWPLRWGCVAAAAAAVLHGVVDVPAHRVALGWWILLLVGLGFQSVRGRDDKSPAIQKALFIVGGLGALTLGVQLIRAEWFGAAALPPFAATRARDEVLAIFNRQDTAGALDRAQAAVEVSPMAAPLYYQLGTLWLHFDGTDAEVDAAFDAQRRLNPTAPSVPLQQGEAWLAVDPKRTIALWLDALDRQGRIDQAQGLPPERLNAFFVDLVHRSSQAPDVQRPLAAIASRSPGFMLGWLESAAEPIVREKLPSILEQTELLTRFSSPQQQRFLLLWYAKGLRDDLARFIVENDRWQAAAWPVQLRFLVDARRFEEAVRAAAAHDHISLALPVVSATEIHPSVALVKEVDPVDAFDVYWRAGNIEAARQVLDDAAKSDAASLADPAIWRLKAALDARDGAWPAAWANLSRYLRQSKLDESVP